MPSDIRMCRPITMLRPGQTKSGRTDTHTDAKHQTKHVTAIINFIGWAFKRRP